MGSPTNLKFVVMSGYIRVLITKTEFWYMYEDSYTRRRGPIHDGGVGRNYYKFLIYANIVVKKCEKNESITDQSRINHGCVSYPAAPYIYHVYIP